MKTKSELFKTAWEIARNAVVKFGGKVKEYFALSLKQAYSQLKNQNNMDKPIKENPLTKVRFNLTIYANNTVYINGVKKELEEARTDIINYIKYEALEEARINYWSPTPKEIDIVFDAFVRYFNERTTDEIVNNIILIINRFGDCFRGLISRRNNIN